MLIFATSYVVEQRLWLQLWVGYLIYFKPTRVSSIAYVNYYISNLQSIVYIFGSIEATNKLINKGMCVLLFDVFNGCSLVQLRKWIG